MIKLNEFNQSSCGLRFSSTNLQTLIEMDYIRLPWFRLNHSFNICKPSERRSTSPAGIITVPCPNRSSLLTSLLLLLLHSIVPNQQHFVLYAAGNHINRRFSDANCFGINIRGLLRWFVFAESGKEYSNNESFTFGHFHVSSMEFMSLAISLQLRKCPSIQFECENSKM